MIFRVGLYFLAAFMLLQVEAQIMKIDKGYLAIDSSNYWLGSTMVSFAFNDRGSTSEQDVLYLGIQNTSDVVYVSEKSALILITSLNYFKLGDGPFIFNGAAHVRQIFNRKKRVSPEIYVQSQFDDSRDLNLRWLYGGGIRWNATHPVNTLFLGVGFFSEHEIWDAGEITVRKNLVKLNSYVGTQFDINDNLEISGIAYFQFGYDQEISRVRDRIFASIEFSNAVTDRIVISFRFNYEHDNLPIVPLNRHLYETNIGLRYRFE